MNTSALYVDRTPRLISPGSRAVIFLVVIVVHALLVSLPYLRTLRPTPVKENMFKVKLGSDKPSHDVEVGKPERTRPTGVEPATPAPAEPKFTPPKPKPKPKAEPQFTPPKPKPKPKAEPKFTPPKPKPSPKPEPKVTPPKHTGHSAATKPDTSSSDNRRSSSSRPTGTRRSGGNNFNNTVPIGSRNTGQRLGKPDHRTPQGGLTEEEEAYYNRLKKLLDFKWVEPSRTHLGDLRPRTTIELEISADGRVLSSKIVQASGNASMDESIRRLLKVLDRVPAPPNGALIIHVNMEVK